MPAQGVGAFRQIFLVPVLQTREKSNISSMKMRAYDLIIIKSKFYFYGAILKKSYLDVLQVIFLFQSRSKSQLEELN